MAEQEKTAREVLAEVQAARGKLLDAARPEAIAKLDKRGKLSARERIRRLVDPDTFDEIGALVAAGGEDDPPGAGQRQRDTSPADGVVVGTARIEGRPAVVVSQDFSVFGGSIGKLGSAKTQRAIKLAMQRGIPMIMLLDGGGHRIQDGQNSRHFANANGFFHDLARASGWIPVVSLMLGAGFAGPTNYAGMSDFVVMVRGLSTMGLAGPALVKAGTGETVEQEEVGGASAQVDRHGLACLGVESEDAAFAACRRYLSYLPGNARAALPLHDALDPPTRRAEALLDLVPANPRKAYDVRRVIALLADKESLFEIKPTYARNIITAFTRLGGRPVGFIANQPLHLGGMVDANACDKAAHFIALCDAFGVPLVSLIDVPGFLIGSAAEKSVLGKRSAKLIYEWGHTTVPRVSIILRKGYGLGYFAMNGGRSFASDACFAWPTAQICAMSVEGAIDVAFRRQYAAAPDPAKRRLEMIEETRQRINALGAAEGFGIDDIIDPRDTRRRLIETLAQCQPRRPNDHPPKYRSIAPI